MGEDEQRSLGGDRGVAKSLGYRGLRALEELVLLMAVVDEAGLCTFAVGGSHAPHLPAESSLAAPGVVVLLPEGSSSQAFMGGTAVVPGGVGRREAEPSYELLVKRAARPPSRVLVPRYPGIEIHPPPDHQVS
ncbi:hypothetical protein JRQ81_004574 [Phrynocephalus forsythii]|uniref:Uncharacterized protein n=1 Tax=Phrynocephalus forsythii TaxID=171643 RepID=A0A9Q1AV59_9SAUR|nr:hypothetical protein JRQ81_004574 [Phrynocephalus forsythii]